MDLQPSMLPSADIGGGSDGASSSVVAMSDSLDAVTASSISTMSAHSTTFHLPRPSAPTPPQPSAYRPPPELVNVIQTYRFPDPASTSLWDLDDDTESDGAGGDGEGESACEDDDEDVFDIESLTEPDESLRLPSHFWDGYAGSTATMGGHAPVLYHRSPVPTIATDSAADSDGTDFVVQSPRSARTQPSRRESQLSRSPRTPTSPHTSTTMAISSAREHGDGGMVGAEDYDYDTEPESPRSQPRSPSTRSPNIVPGMPSPSARHRVPYRDNSLVIAYSSSPPMPVVPLMDMRGAFAQNAVRQENVIAPELPVVRFSVGSFSSKRMSYIPELNVFLHGNFEMARSASPSIKSWMDIEPRNAAEADADTVKDEDGFVDTSDNESSVFDRVDERPPTAEDLDLYERELFGELDHMESSKEDSTAPRRPWLENLGQRKWQGGDLEWDIGSQFSLTDDEDAAPATFASSNSADSIEPIDLLLTPYHHRNLTLDP
ncbi:hypothetical protein HK101_007649, partial [Irineochytrium annulatum]